MDRDREHIIVVTDEYNEEHELDIDDLVSLAMDGLSGSERWLRDNLNTNGFYPGTRVEDSKAGTAWVRIENKYFEIQVREIEKPAHIPTREEE